MSPEPSIKTLLAGADDPGPAEVQEMLLFVAAPVYLAALSAGGTVEEGLRRAVAAAMKAERAKVLYERNVLENDE